MYKLVFPEAYEIKAKRVLQKHLEVASQYRKCLTLLELDPFHPALRLHKFKTTNFEGYSVSINLSYRISIEFLISDKEITFVNVGDHQDIYGKK